ALEIALDDLKRLNRPSKLLIISDILQTGIPEKELYQRVNHLISSFDIDQVVTVGPATFRNADQFILPSLHFPSTSGLLAEMDSVDFRNKAVLIKGAKQFRFDRVVRELMAKGHDSTLEINLSRLEHNLHFYRNQLSPEVKVMAMIKAYAYGSGNAEIAEILEVNHVDYLGVAYINEGIELREEGIQLPIFILNADARSFHQLVKYNLEPEIYSLHQLEKLVEELNFQRVSTPFNIHLKVDTGMHRLGFDEQNFGDVLELVKRSKSIRVASILSHLAASDDPKHDGFTLQQIATFDRLHAAATKALGYAIDRHICNTAGIMRFPKAHYEMVRIGIGVYGVPSCAEDRDQVKPVGALKTRVSQVRMIGAGESVGYTRSSMAQHERKIATIPIGYADGFPRSLSEGKGEVVIKGQRYQVVGKVCMDMTMVDITGSEIQDGDEVIVFGDNPKVTELATSAATIPYEIIAGISRRVQRLYFRD
ncbi:MAG: alanine racemase, partial [Flavobacteriales bacterium]|nr:alanine racemase [Flavobacteriales bacterium]